MTNHQEQQDQQSMDPHKNSNLRTTTNPQDSKTTECQQDIHGSKKTLEEKGSIFKNAHEVVKKLDSLSCSSLAAGEHNTKLPPPPPPSPQDFKNAYEDIKKPNSLSCSPLAAGEADRTTLPPPPPQEMAVAVAEESGRERLKRHRVEMAGRVWIPDIWGHEDLLKDWIDCTVFDSSLGNKNIMSARAALVQEGRSTLRIDNRC